MARPGPGFTTAAALFISSLTATVMGGDHPPRERPPNAVQPPGASFEKQISRGQKALLVKDTLRATVAESARNPVRSAAVGASRLSERLAVRVTESIPRSPVPPGRQSPEAGGPCTPAKLTPLYDSGPAFRALLDLIATARDRIDLMIFGWDDDRAGRTAAAALIARARAGVTVRLMVDRGGYVSGEGNARVALGALTFLDELRAEPNVRVIETPDAFFRFDHRKVAVVDDRVVWTGGMILTSPALERWHNFAFLAEGPIVAQYAALFAERWEELGGCPASTCPWPAGAPAAVPNATVRMVRTDIGHRSLKEAVYGAVDSARHHIYLENPYFSDQILVKKLVAARARGVDVRAFLTMRGDVRLMNKIVAVTANHLLRGGVRVYLYPAMTHVKAMSVDGRLAYLGTGNFDELSLRNNREVSLTVRGPELIRQIDANLFLRDMAASEELHALLPLPRGWLFLGATLLWY
ncbi:MAG: phosphatidylserine/phosphatidylglycerophosphate/cardiolipin synthase family protein [Planctomycetia bacterium]|nr:phosphatidylserine/phosphatidylglycerophosphate/cardiolipin synthase family protein [Planctomycetia bacterium]